MKICVFHNLKPGGALNEALEIINILSKNNQVHIYSHNKSIRHPKSKLFLFPINKTENIFQHLHQAIFELNKSELHIANLINSRKYDFIIIFPCIIVQTPHILKYIDKNHIYFFTEPKREFYEMTNFDHYSIKKMLARIIRFPIKIIDKINCKKAINIATNSYYSNHQLFKIYNKKGFVLYPGLKNNKPKLIMVKNNKNIISIGQVSMIKGHDFSIKQLSKTKHTLNIIGRYSIDKDFLINLSNQLKTKLKIYNTENNKLKNKLLLKHSMYLANQLNEPFGISTLEACNNNRILLGKNEGGTPEIIKHGLNGLLYPNSIHISRNVLSDNLKDTKYIYNTSKINWKHTTQSLLRLYHYLKNEPNE